MRRNNFTLESLLARAIPEPNTGCWFWLGCPPGAAHPQVRVHGKHVLAHRLAFELAFGPIPDGMLVCHSCDTPPCIAPDHLFLGTNADNTADMIAKGRQSWRSWDERLTCARGHEIAVVGLYRTKRKNGEPRIECAQCARDHQAAVRRRRAQ